MLLNGKDLRAMVRAEELAKRDSEGIYCPRIDVFSDINDEGDTKRKIDPRKEDRRKFLMTLITLGIFYFICLLIFVPCMGPHSDAGLILAIIGGMCVITLLPFLLFLTTKNLTPERVVIFVDHMRDFKSGGDSSFDYYNFVKLTEKHGNIYLKLIPIGKTQWKRVVGTPYIIIVNRESGKIMYTYNAYEYYLDASLRDSVKSPLDVDINPKEIRRW